jgi:hypothetical protein
MHFLLGVTVIMTDPELAAFSSKQVPSIGPVKNFHSDYQINMTAINISKF